MNIFLLTSLLTNAYYYSGINDPLYISGNDLELIDEYFENVEEVKTIGGSFNPPLYKVFDIFYATPNPNFNNIYIDYLIKQEDGTFEEFDWGTLSSIQCIWGFDTRFPHIAKSKATIAQDVFVIKQSSPYTGKIQYNMESYGFIILFSNKTMKLRIKIKDRALHLSNVIETPEFTLESIKR